MKKKDFYKQLAFNKRTVSNLNTNEQASINGGDLLSDTVTDIITDIIIMTTIHPPEDATQAYYRTCII